MKMTDKNWGKASTIHRACLHYKSISTTAVTSWRNRAMRKSQTRRRSSHLRKIQPLLCATQFQIAISLSGPRVQRLKWARAKPKRSTWVVSGRAWTVWASGWQACLRAATWIRKRRVVRNLTLLFNQSINPPKQTNHKSRRPQGCSIGRIRQPRWFRSRFAAVVWNSQL